MNTQATGRHLKSSRFSLALKGHDDVLIAGLAF